MASWEGEGMKLHRSFVVHAVPGGELGDYESVKTVGA